mgnify:CR=1 FL=1
MVIGDVFSPNISQIYWYTKLSSYTNRTCADVWPPCFRARLERYATHGESARVKSILPLSYFSYTETSDYLVYIETTKLTLEKTQRYRKRRGECHRKMHLFCNHAFLDYWLAKSLLTIEQLNHSTLLFCFVFFKGLGWSALIFLLIWGWNILMTSLKLVRNVCLPFSSRKFYCIL